MNNSINPWLICKVWIELSNGQGPDLASFRFLKTGTWSGLLVPVPGGSWRFFDGSWGNS